MAEDTGLTEYTVTGQDAIQFICEAPMGFAEVSPDGRFRWVNDAMADILNAHKAQVLGSSWSEWDYAADEDTIELEQGLRQEVQAGRRPGYKLVKRCVQLGHTPHVPRVVWGACNVFGKFNSQGVFLGYRFTFVPYFAQESGGYGARDWGKWLHATLTFLITNWRTVSVIALTLAGLMRVNFTTLSEQLRAAQDVTQQLDDSLQGLPPPSLSLPSGPPAPNTGPTN